MIIQIFEDNLTLEDASQNVRNTSRVIIKHSQKNKYLMIYVPELKRYSFPGGGVNEGETFEKAAKREVLEETGYQVEIIEKSCVIEEYFREQTYINHYFLGRITASKTTQNLTNKELERHQTYKWVDKDTLIMILSNPEGLNTQANHVMNREFMAFMHSLKD
jgi:8-oxo-dGTP diphosphatase